MLKIRGLTFSVLVLLSFFIASAVMVPQVYSQTSSAVISNYSWYTRPSDGDFIVVGEVLNTGTTVLNNVTFTGSVITSDGQVQASGSTIAYGDHILPGQKIPFYLDLNASHSTSGNLNWVSLGVERVAFAVTQANAVSTMQYPNVDVIATNNATGSDGLFYVEGFARNYGNRTVNNVRVVATYYDAAGKVIAVGFTNFLESNGNTTLEQYGVLPFRVVAFDSTPRAAQIANFSLVAQIASPIVPAVLTSPSPPPEESIEPGPITSPSESASPTSSPGVQQQSLPLDLIIVIVVIIALVIVIAVLVVKRKPRSATTV